MQTYKKCIYFFLQTCLELLKRNVLTIEDLKYEHEHLKSFGILIDDSNSSELFKVPILNVSLAYQTRQVSRLTFNIAYLAETAEAEAEMVRRGRVLPTPPSPATTQRPLSQDELSPDEADAEVKLDSSVCSVLDGECVNLADFSVADVLLQITVDNPASGNRKTTYFGDVSYRYGRIKHEANPYPQCDLFKTMFERIQAVIPDFSRSAYTCLVALYPDGPSQIKYHSDDETQIQPDSSIITVSIGSARTITFQNQSGVINESHITLPHGSVYSMSRSSKVSWKHSIKPEPSITNPRISFTFRRLIPDSDIPPRPRAPPITHPDDYRSKDSPPCATHHGILLLTDSILSPTPEYIFDKIDGHRCIKKVNNRLVNLLGFEPEFKYRKTVVISGGVNDLSCYGLRAHTLADLVCSRLAATCRKHRQTTFVYNSMLYNGHRWLNGQVDEFNKIMFELSLDVPNLFFFNSSSVIERSPLSHKWSNVIKANDPRKLHITLAARRLITDQLVKGVDLVSRVRDIRELKNWTWPLRPHFAEQLKHRHPP